ncbi:MAG: hypothetical protein CMM21_00895 [Rhodospirillaceae bacterium]|jgi:uncharacterized OB-fold protein|nr:hypothetical protein [Rhodospirillaceae bacterium]MDP6267421.1 OB-fold domain-containing protein [Arenicellales bacterium]|tara:strand:- start:14396 stop:14854 length:459 start_codon:yes stop_codon:yes gene_type:complete
MSTASEETTTNHSDLPPVADGIFAVSAEDPNRFELVGGHCQRCDDYSFPRSMHCCHCRAETDEHSLGSDGNIYSLAVVRIKPPLGLPRPYAVAYIDLEAVPLRVFCLLDPVQCEDAVIGAGVRLSVGPLGVNNAGQDCLRPFFKLIAENEDN